MTLERWRKHSPITDPGDAAFLFEGLPTDVGALCRLVQGVLIHSDWLAAYDMEGPHPGPVSRETLPLSQRLKLIAGDGLRPLDLPRSARERSIGTCRDYTVMLCGMLRHQGIPARVRCGFAAYFTTNPWEDHWLCEYWRPAEQRWCRVDAQLDEVQRKHLGIAFDPTDVPPKMFMTANDAWRRCREENAGASFGHGAASGLWLVRVNVVRDHYALHQSETSVWDGWRSAIGRHEQLGEGDLVATDAIAAQPEETRTTDAPPWQA